MTYELDLSGHKALVTGGGQGVGRGIAHAFAAAGAAVVVNDFVAERANEVVDELTALGATATAAPFDVSDYDAVVSAVGDSGIDILANNAGNAGPEGFNFAPFAESEPADWNRYFSVNLFGVMNCTRAVIPGMISQGWGRVITIVSDAARWGEPRMAAYSAAKSGAAGFSRSLARDVGRFGVTVNNIALASIDSTGQIAAAERTPEAAERFKKQMSSYIIRRFGRPDDIAAMATFLASPRSEWITGQTYPVNGGYTVNQ
jgi:NAD(P)-dependent dehydrogenase (short-subunit alcohol dehydrogenase family)